MSLVILRCVSHPAILGCSCPMTGGFSGASADRSIQHFICLALDFCPSLSSNVYQPRTRTTFSGLQYGDQPFGTGPTCTSTISAGRKSRCRWSQRRSSSCQLTSETGAASSLQEAGLSASEVASMLLETKLSACKKEMGLVHRTEPLFAPPTSLHPVPSRPLGVWVFSGCSIETGGGHVHLVWQQ